MSEYNKLILQNIAPSGTKKIGLYNKNGDRIVGIPIAYLAFPKPSVSGQKLYSFGALSDVHYQNTKAEASEDFQRALTYLNDTEKVDFICICGDLTDNGTSDELTEYRNAVDTYSPNTPVYAIMGNHDARGGLFESIEQYTGNPYYYSIEQKNDVFIFVGAIADWNTEIFSIEELQWLYETLEANRNKRCFVFQHYRPEDGCGNALGIYSRTYDDWDGYCAEVFESLMKHYQNVILFHGHSHLKLYMQEYDELANYDNVFGCHSVHIPSIAVPRDINGAVNPPRVDVYADSEGYVVDVYENGIHLRGRDFVGEKFLPIASYWLDTTLKTIEPNTYTDSTGTIQTEIMEE